jgi:hypothetical protein
MLWVAATMRRNVAPSHSRELGETDPNPPTTGGSQAVAYELSMMASGTDCRMCISALGSLLEGVHMMQIPFPKELPFAASELFPATFDASETLLKVRTPVSVQ